MKIKMLVHQAGLREDRRPGQIYEIPDAEAQRMIVAGFAEPAHEAVRTATRQPSRKAVAVDTKEE